MGNLYISFYIQYAINIQPDLYGSWIDPLPYAHVVLQAILDLLWPALCFFCRYLIQDDFFWGCA